MCNCRGGCSCTSNSTALPIGNTGATGKTGAQGLYGGFSGDWLFDATSTGGAPDDYSLRFNGLDVSTDVTTITIYKTGPSLADYTAFLASLLNDSQYGYVRLFQQTDSTAFWMGKITAVLDSGLYTTLTVTYITASNAAISSIFAASTSVVLTFSPSGAGTSLVLYNETSPVSTSGGGVDALMSYSIPANQLKNDGDVVEIDGSFVCSGTSETKELLLRINGSNFITKTGSGTLYLTKDIKYAKLKLIITRIDEFSLYITIELGRTSITYLTHSSGGYSFDESAIVSDLSSNTLTIACLGQNIAAGSETITQNQLLVRYFNK